MGTVQVCRMRSNLFQMPIYKSRHDDPDLSASPKPKPIGAMHTTPPARNQEHNGACRDADDVLPCPDIDGKAWLESSGLILRI